MRHNNPTAVTPDARRPMARLCIVGNLGLCLPRRLIPGNQRSGVGIAGTVWSEASSTVLAWTKPVGHSRVMHDATDSGDARNVWPVVSLASVAARGAVFSGCSLAVLADRGSPTGRRASMGRGGACLGSAVLGGGGDPVVTFVLGSTRAGVGDRVWAPFAIHFASRIFDASWVYIVSLNALRQRNGSKCTFFEPLWRMMEERNANEPLG